MRETVITTVVLLYYIYIVNVNCLMCYQHQQTAYLTVEKEPIKCPAEAKSCFKVVNHKTKLATRSCQMTTCMVSQ